MLCGLTPASIKHCLGMNGYWPAPAKLAQHLTDIGFVSACTLWTHHQRKALPSVEWMLARAGDGGPGLNRHWVSAVVTYHGHEHQLKIVMNIE